MHCLLLLVLLALPVGQTVAAESDPPVKIENTPATVLYLRDYKGDYSQHVAAAEAVKADGKHWQLPADPVVGVYPDDPDAVGMANVRWSLGLVVSSQAKDEPVERFKERTAKLAFRLGEDRLHTLESGTVAVIASTIQESQKAGLAMLRWLPTSGYAQSGPTRMEYFEKGLGLANPVRIVVPVRKRGWEWKAAAAR